MRHTIFRGWAWAAFIALSLAVGCTDKSTAAAGSAPIYVYDDASKNVLVWNDVSVLFTAGTAPAPDRTINIGSMVNGFQLGWGGMTLDATNQRLYLVSQNGNSVLRILRANTQNGVVLNTDYINFSLENGNAAGLSNGTFGQASVNANGDLLVTESDSSGKSQVLLVPYSVQMNGGTSLGTPLAAVTGDTGCTGITQNTARSTIYAYYEGGSDIISNNVTYSGPRLRFGSQSSGFSDATSNVIIDRSGDDVTKLEKYGSLAFDYTSNSGLLYMARQYATDPVLVFSPSFGSGLQVAPVRTLTTPTNSNNYLLRIIAHGVLKDWLAGALATTTDNAIGSGTNQLILWKSPSAGDTHVAISLDSSVKILGLALDGSR